MSELLSPEMVNGAIAFGVVALPLLGMALKFRPPLTNERAGKKQQFSPQMVFDSEAGWGMSVDKALEQGLITKDQVPDQQERTLHDYGTDILSGKVENPHI